MSAGANVYGTIGSRLLTVAPDNTLDSTRPHASTLQETSGETYARIQSAWRRTLDIASHACWTGGDAVFGVVSVDKGSVSYEDRPKMHVVYDPFRVQLLRLHQLWTSSACPKGRYRIYAVHTS